MLVALAMTSCVSSEEEDWGEIRSEITAGANQLIADGAAGTRLEASPAVSFFTDSSGLPFWVVCHNDTTHRGDPQPNASGITCDTLKPSRMAFTSNVIKYQQIWSTIEPYVDGDPQLARDPGNPNVVWIVASINWLNWGTNYSMSSIAVGRLVRDPATGLVKVCDGTTGPVSTCSANLTPIGSGVATGPTNPNKGPRSMFPTIAIDPHADASGAFHQYIAFLNADHSTGVDRQRIVLLERDMSVSFGWSAAMPPVPPALPDPANWTTDANGWNTVAGNVRFWRPQLAVQPDNHQVGVTYARLVTLQAANGFIHNDGSIGTAMFNYLSVWDPVSHYTAARDLTPGATAGSIRNGDATDPALQFSAVPYVAIAAGNALERTWHVVASQQQAFAPDPRRWDATYFSTPDGTQSGKPHHLVNEGPGGQPMKSLIFPALAVSPTNGPQSVVTIGYLTSLDDSQRAWNAIAISSSNAGASFAPAVASVGAGAPFTPAPTTGGDYSWGGSWGGTPSPGYFGYWTGLAAFGTRAQFAWTDSRRGSRLIEVWGSELTIP